MKATLKVELRKDYKSSRGKRMICLRYTAYRRSTLISLSIGVEDKHWNARTSSVRSYAPDSAFKNKVIFDMLQKGNNIVKDNFYKPLPLPEFIEKLKDRNHGNEDFYAFIENELELIKSSRAKQTLSNYRNLINRMKEWKPTLTFNEITLEYIQRFHDHELKTGNILSTIYKKHANFKFLLGLAINKEQIQKNPYDKFPIKKITKAQNNDILTEEELKILQQAYDQNRYTDGKKEVLRDFLFSCYTSLSYAEYHTVTYGDLKPVTVKVNGKEETYPLLCNDRQKTSVLYKIPIVSNKVEQLLERKTEKGDKELFQQIFSPLANQPTNRYLKEIIKDLKINKTMTFHRGRHSFRTIAAKKGIRDSIAERIMGHAEGNDIQNIYMHLSDEDIVREMLDKWVV